MKLKNVVTSLLLMVALSFAVSAQEKYVYATITLTGQNLTVATESDFTETKLPADAFTRSAFGTDFRPLLKKVNEMAGEGWEVYNNTDTQVIQGAHTIVYYLRKKT